MRLTTILSFFFITFLNLAQDEPYTEFYFDVGVKYTFMTKNSKDGSYPCSGQQCYHQYSLNQAKTTGNQGTFQFSYVRNRIILPFGIGYQIWRDELTGTNNEGIKLFGTTYYEHTELNYKGYSEHANLFTGIGLNFLKSSEKMFIGPIFRVHYSLLIGDEITVTTNESQTTIGTGNYSGNATDYLNQNEASKQTLLSSLGLLVRFNTNKIFQFTFEAGYDWSNRNSISIGHITPIRGGVYAQFNFGVNLKKFAKN